ncbi:unnamed protein product [Moneuplotes crassus]|uniref:Uncharacterized protein n=1 Tax=Euplotes crassus TaxID=5936 RepID=A0AAD2D6N5_EUPCR|nr:unnamed protein product [Moneuplotes crassus]
MSDRDIKISTKAILGLFGGLKTSAIYTTFVAPIVARYEVSKFPEKRFIWEYLRISSSYSFLFVYSFVMMFTTRQIIEKYSSDYAHEIRQLTGLNSKICYSATVFAFCIPWGWSGNLLFTGRYLKGAFTLTLSLSMLFYSITQYQNNGNSSG